MTSGRLSRMRIWPATMPWLAAARPRTLPAAIAPVLIGLAMARASGELHFALALVTLFAAVMIQIGTNFANDYFDFKKGTDTDSRIGPVRVTASGLVTPSQIKRAIVLAFGLAFLAGIYLVYRGGWPIVIIGSTAILFGLLYTAGPLPLGYLGLGDIFVFIYFGPVAAAGTYYVQTLTLTKEVLLAGIGPGLLSVAILTVNNLRDADSDRHSGKRTLAVRFGKRFARIEYIVCLSLAAAIPFWMVVQEMASPAIFAASIVLLPGILSIRTLYRNPDGPALTIVLEQTGRLLLLYSILFSIGWIW